MESKVPNWFWATLAVIIVATIASVMYCNKASALYDQGTKTDLSTASNQATTNTTTTSTQSSPQASTTQPTSGVQSVLESLANM